MCGESEMNNRIPIGKLCEGMYYYADNQPYRCPFLDTESPYCQRFDKELIYDAECRYHRCPECENESPLGGKIVIVGGE